MKKFFSLFTAVLFAGSMLAEAITCADARELALAGNTDEVTVRGYVTEIVEAWSSYKNVSFWMADEKGGGQVFEAFRVACETAEEAPTVGALVEVTGTLKKYTKNNVDIPETNAGGSFVIIEPGDPVVPEVDDADVTFSGADFAGQGTEQTGSAVTATKDGVTFTCDKGYSDDAHSTLRCYKNGVITITSETEQIGKLVFTFFSTYTGDLNTEVVVNANEWTYTLTNQARIEKLQIYFGEYEEPQPVEIQTISVAEAMAIGEAIEGSGKTDEKYSVIGYVINAKPYGDKYEGAQTFYMSDDRNAAKGEFTAFNCNVAAPGVEAGDYVIVTGRIQKYVYESGDYVIEITGGDVLYAAEGVENVVLTEKAQKVMIDGVLYIVRGNKMFDVRGAQVR